MCPVGVAPTPRMKELDLWELSCDEEDDELAILDKKKE